VLAQEVNFYPLPKSNVTVDDIVRNLTQALKDGLHFTFYRKKDIPERYETRENMRLIQSKLNKCQFSSYHYKNNRRIGPVVLFPDINYYMVNRQGSDTRVLPRGTHGYTTDSPEMKPFFVARGPSFKKGYTISGAVMLLFCVWNI